jgi:glycine cleavage system aminomethyltransferase T
VTSPLETVARNHGAVMAERHGRRVPAHFGSTAAEEAVCVHSVGMADRAERETFELRGSSEAVEEALLALGERAWFSFVDPDRALVRCEPWDAAACEALGIAHNRTAAYAAIGLVGPRAGELLDTIDLNPSGLVIQEARDRWEVILPADHGPELWNYLLEVGEPFDLACVGHDALDRLAASRRVRRG